MSLLRFAARAASAGFALFAAMFMVGLASTWPAEAQAASKSEIAFGLSLAFLPILAVLAIVGISVVGFFVSQAFHRWSERRETERKTGRPVIFTAAGLMLALALGTLVVASGARADFSDAGERSEFWRVATGFYDRGVPPAVKRFVSKSERIAPDRSAIVNALYAEAARQGVPGSVAVRIAHVESRFNCGAVGPKTRHGHARGVLQVLPSSAESLEPGSSRRLNDCATGIRVGVAHMRRCMDAGAHSGELIARCHVGGVLALRSKLRRGAEAYARSYVGMFREARVVTGAPDAFGWIVRNTVAVDPAGRS